MPDGGDVTSISLDDRLQELADIRFTRATLDARETTLLAAIATDSAAESHRARRELDKQ